jgi:hypothetical protein
MPNWCMNQVILSGPKKVMDEIAATGLSLDKIVPCPDKLRGVEKTTFIPKNEAKLRKELQKEYGVSTEFDWHVLMWGTKWDISVGDIRVEQCYGNEDEYEINVSFDSAWSPPVKAMQHLYEKYKRQGLKLWMEYFEPGASYLGTATGDKGIFTDEYREYKNADELQKYVDELEHCLAEPEVEYRRGEEESKSMSTCKITKPSEKKSPKSSTAKSTKKVAAKKVAAKKVAAKRATTKTAAKKTTKSRSTVKKTAGKAKSSASKKAKEATKKASTRSTVTKKTTRVSETAKKSSVPKKSTRTKSVTKSAKTRSKARTNSR